MRNILIAEEKVNISECAFGFPWKYDSNCFNFRRPKECITIEEIGGIEDKSDVESLVIGCNLTDYSFIEDMVNLRQLFIYSGENVRNLEFLRKLTKLSQVYITNSSVESLAPLVCLIREQKKLFDLEKDFNKRLFMMMNAICIDSDHELDICELKENGRYTSEIIVNGEHVR